MELLLDPLDIVLAVVKVLIDTSSRNEHLVVTSLPLVEGGVPVSQRLLKVGHRGDQPVDEAVAPAKCPQESHRVVDLFKPIEHPDKVIGLAGTGMDAGDEPLEVGHLGHLRCELLQNTTVCVEHFDGVEPLVELLDVAERMANPLAEQALPEGSDASVEEVEERPLGAAVGRVGKDFEVDESLAIQDQGAVPVDRVVPLKVTLRQQAPIQLQDAEVVSQASESRHDQVFVPRLGELLRPGLLFSPVAGSKVAAAIQLAPCDVGIPELSAGLEVIPDGGWPRVVLEDAQGLGRQARLLQQQLTG